MSSRVGFSYCKLRNVWEHRGTIGVYSCATCEPHLLNRIIAIAGNKATILMIKTELYSPINVPPSVVHKLRRSFKSTKITTQDAHPAELRLLGTQFKDFSIK
ncbi:hypothetical protein PGT21_036085 [Puccinia graminis f. sp. tritici]|uniref:Uncharacterized protein n=1 Tax=Puccinia graminis f. sp. tritici TaxID=56615 RepID=A0A5B0NFW7_PUCGR|nr:hypothetical protein PGT21_036085 [Puccinia graminis f. sp. tritici]